MIHHTQLFLSITLEKWLHPITDIGQHNSWYEMQTICYYIDQTPLLLSKFPNRHMWLIVLVNFDEFWSTFVCVVMKNILAYFFWDMV